MTTSYHLLKLSTEGQRQVRETLQLSVLLMILVGNTVVTISTRGFLYSYRLVRLLLGLKPHAAAVFMFYWTFGVLLVGLQQLSIRSTKRSLPNGVKLTILLFAPLVNTARSSVVIHTTNKQTIH
jgi:hypothetical protein